MIQMFVCKYTWKPSCESQLHFHQSPQLASWLHSPWVFCYYSAHASRSGISFGKLRTHRVYHGRHQDGEKGDPNSVLQQNKKSAIHRHKQLQESSGAQLKISKTDWGKKPWELFSKKQKKGCILPVLSHSQASILSTNKALQAINRKRSPGRGEKVSNQLPSAFQGTVWRSLLTFTPLQAQRDGSEQEEEQGLPVAATQPEESRLPGTCSADKLSGLCHWREQ